LPEPEPTDPELVRIVEIESRTIVVDPAAKRHKLVIATERILKHARPDEKGILQLRYDQFCLELHVSKEALNRTLLFVNAVILALEAEGFSVSVQEGRHGTGAEIFGHLGQEGSRRGYPIRGPASCSVSVPDLLDRQPHN
jgi:hypothetical protein